MELADDYGIHIVNKDGKPYVTGPELSNILFGKDILRSKVSVVSPKSSSSMTSFFKLILFYIDIFAGN